MTKYLNEITEVSPSTFQDFNQVTFGGVAVFNSFMYSNPILRVALFGPNLYTSSYPVVIRSSASNWRTFTKQGRPMYDGLRLFAQVLGGKETHPAGGNWRPYVSLRKRGITSYTDYDFYPWGTFEPGEYVGLTSNILTSYYVPFIKYGVEYLATYDTIQNVSQWILDNYVTLFGVRFDKRRLNRRYVVDMYGLKVTDEEISFNCQVWYFYAPHAAKNGWSTNYDVKISKLVPSEPRVGGYTISIANIAPLVKYGSASTPSQVTDPSPFITPMVNLGRSYSYAKQIALLEEDKRTIVDAAPILFYTQSKAMTDMLGDVSRNFEGFIEAPEIITMLEDIVVADSVFDVIKSFKTSTLGRKIELVVTGVIGGYFAWIFAIKPTYELIPQLIEDLKIAISKKYESTITYEGDGTDLATYDQGFIDYVLQGEDLDSVLYFKATFHTEISLKASDRFIKRAFEAYLHDLSARGLVPSVSQAWALTQLSFVVDWFALISDRIVGLESYFSSWSSDIDSIGHSASNELRLRNGLIRNSYIRSDNTTELLHPPRKAWLQPPGAPISVGLPLAIMVAIGLGKKLP